MTVASRTNRRHRPHLSGLYLVAAALENGYYSRLRRYYATQREHHQPLDQAPPAATLQDLSNDHLPF